MQINKETMSHVLNFIHDPKKKVLLLIGETTTEFNCELEKSIRKADLTYIFVDLSNQADIENILIKLPQDQPIILYFNNKEVNRTLENIYVKYQLERWQAKLIVVHSKALLHPTFEVSLYFAPIHKGRIQQHLLTKIELPSLKVAAPSIKKAKNIDQPAQTYSQLPIEVNILGSHFLNKKLMTRDIAIMHMLGDRVLQSKNFELFLFTLLYASRQDERLKVAAANAITALNYARITFAGMDLSNIKIPHANLTGAILRDALVREADFTEVKLNLAILTNTDFNGTVLTQADFGEYPTLKASDYGQSYIWFDTNNNLIAAG